MDNVIAFLEGRPRNNVAGVSGMDGVDERFAALQTTGRRDYQEDSFGFFDGRDLGIDDNEHAVLLVADGMGGHVGGAIASDLLCKTFVEAYPRSAGPIDEREIADILEKTRDAPLEDSAAALIQVVGRGRTSLSGQCDCVVVCSAMSRRVLKCKAKITRQQLTEKGEAMFRSLSPGAVGASVENLADGLDLARAARVRPDITLALAKSRLWVRKRPSRWPSARVCACRRGDFPLIFAGRRPHYQASLAQLPALAKVAAALGVRRTATCLCRPRTS